MGLQAVAVVAALGALKRQALAAAMERQKLAQGTAVWQQLGPLDCTFEVLPAE